MAKLLKNSNPNYYTDFPCASNCGGFAFNLCGWYAPYDFLGTRKSKIRKMRFEECPHEEIERAIIELDKKFMIENFGGALTTCENPNLIPIEKKVIAYRIYVDEKDREIDTDFHFKVRLNGEWYHKQGSEPPEKCELDSEHEWPLLEDDDETILHWYDSPILYFVYEEKI